MTEPRPTFVHRPAKRGLIGPFGARQIGIGLVVVIAVVLVLLAATAPLGTSGGGDRNPQATPYVIGAAPAQGLRPGDRAPALSFTRPDGSTFTLTDINGKPVDLAEFRGKGVWINFWASWCPPCQSETPTLRDTYLAYRDRGLEVIGISVQETNASDVAAYARKYGLSYTIAADLSADILHRYGVYALPTQYFIGPDGVIRDVVNGPLDPAQAAREVEAILPSTGSPAAPTASSTTR